MFSRKILLGAALVASSAAPALASAAGMSFPFFGPIVAPEISYCPASVAGFFDIVNRFISFAITIIIVFLAPLVIAYAGFLYVVNPVNATGRGKAKSILWNLTLGVVIALSAWLIVDTLFAAFVPGGKPFEQRWYETVTGTGDLCLKQAGALMKLNQADLGKVISGTGTSAVLSFGTGACSADTVMAGAAQGGYTLTQAQANTLACLAKPESSCGAALKNYMWNKGSSAAGAFQVTLQGNSSCYENAACYQAAGVSGPLNCAAGFSGGNPKTDAVSQAIVERCLKAAANVACSSAAAACVLQKQGFKAWQADAKSVTQTQCVNTYGT